jgi:hypothetical protein
MSLLLLTAFLLAGGGEAATSPGQRRLDKSKEFAYTLPQGWNAYSLPKARHDLIVLFSDDGFNRNILTVDQSGTDPFPELKRKYERDLAKGLKGFKLISSDIVELTGKRKAIRIIDTNTSPGKPIRQVNYILEIGGKRYFVTCTVLEKDGDKYDKTFAAFVNSMAKPEK